MSSDGFHISDEFREWERKMRSQVIQKFDQEIQELRLTYLALRKDQRNEFASWLQQVSTAVEAMPRYGIRIAIRAHLDNSVVDEEGDVVHDGTCSLSPRLMLNAIRAWDSREEYTPPFGAICS